MKSYIIRVNREDDQESHGFAGTVEDAGLGHITAFHSLEELGHILKVPNSTKLAGNDDKKEEDK